MIDHYYADEPMTALDKALFSFASYNAGPARGAAAHRGQETGAGSQRLVSQRRVCGGGENRAGNRHLRRQHLQVLHRLQAGDGAVAAQATGDRGHQAAGLRWRQGLRRSRITGISQPVIREAPVRRGASRLFSRHRSTILATFSPVMTLPHPAVTRMHTMTTTALIAITVRLFADQSRLINLPATITRSTPCCKEPSNARCSAACWAPASAPRPRSTKSTSSFRAAPAALGQHRPRHRRGADQIRPHHHRLLPEHLPVAAPRPSLTSSRRRPSPTRP